MRIGAVWEHNNNVQYRAIAPLRAMEKRGHEIVWPADKEGRADLARLGGCHVVHVYRRANDDTLRQLQKLARAGSAITWDNDDDFRNVPKESPLYGTTGGAAGRRIMTQMKRAIELASSVSTTNDELARTYRHAGARSVEIIPNALAPGVSRRRRRHKGLVIGWIAAPEHLADVARIGIAHALTRIVATHPQARVECIGVDLALAERYRHDRHVPFSVLPRRIGGFDIGIAPLADIPWNRSRSDIKLKEYASVGVPWLASAVGPYADLGEQHGGRLVANTDWFEALDQLIRSRKDRRRLSRNGRAWAQKCTIAAVADRWEHMFITAAQAQGRHTR